MAAKSALNTESRVNVFVLCHNVNTNQKRIAVESALNLTSSEVASDEVDFRAVSTAIFLGFFTFYNVDTYMQTQLKQKLYKVDCKAVSTAGVTHKCKLNLSMRLFCRFF